MPNNIPSEPGRSRGGRIRVLHCIETISSGGVERVRLSYAREMNKDLFELKIVCTQSKGVVLEELRELGVEVISVGTFKSPFELTIYRRLLKIIAEFRPHIIHGAVFEGNSMAFVGKLFGRVPIALMEETSEPIFRSKRANRLLNLYGRIADLFIGISPAVVTYLKESVRIKEQKLKLLPNGIELPQLQEYRLTDQIKIDLNLQEKDFVIGAVGRVYDKVKRFSDLIQAIKILNNIKIKLLLIGNGPDLEMLKEMAIRLNIQDQIHFLGHQANPNLYYELMDVFCIPSMQEGFGLVAVEAMFHGIPVIASDVGGLRSIVINEETGFLIPPKSPDILVQKIQILIQNPENRKTFGERGKQHALLNFTAKKYSRELESMYFELLSKKGLLDSELR